MGTGAAVLGGSWGNGVAIGNFLVRMNYWEIRWANNVVWLNCASGGATYIRDLQYLTWKNCDYSSVIIILLSGGTNASNYLKYWQFDNTNTMTGTAALLHSSNNYPPNYIYVQSANTSGQASYISVVSLQGGVVLGSANPIQYINITNAGTAYGVHSFSVRGGANYYQHCKCTIAVREWADTKLDVIISNCVMTGGATGFLTVTGHNSRVIYARLFNNIFKGLTTQAIYADGIRLIVCACRNNIFDSNAKIISAASGGIFGVKNNGYYNNTSEANWTRGPYDETIAATSYSNYTDGTLHADWILYGPGDGWKCNTADITAHCDTNSFVGINTSTQSHTGVAETAVYQGLGLAPVFSTLA
jgi:hypothetical protein